MTARRLILQAFAFLFAIVTASPSLALDANRHIRDFQHTAWGVADGAPADVWALAQTTDGYLWLGTGSGLYRFDGVRFERFRDAQSPNLDDQNITALLVLPDGALGIGYKSGALGILRDGKIKCFPPPGNKNGLLSGLISDTGGKLYAEMDTGVYQFAGDRFVRTALSWPTPKVGLGGLFAEHSGAIWATAPAGLVRLDTKSGKTTLLPMRFQLLALRPVVAEDPHGQLWISATLGMPTAIRWPDGKAVIDSGTLRANAMPTSSRLMFDRDGTAWGADYGTGIYRRSGSALRETNISADRFTEADGLTSNMAATTLEDREGNIWVGTNGGLDRFRPTNVFSSPSVPTTSAHGYRALTIDGTTYVMAVNSLYRLGKTAVADPRLDGIKWECLYAARSAFVGVCGLDELIEVGPESVRHIRPPAGSPWSTLRPNSAALDNDGTLWVAFSGGGVARVHNGTWSAWRATSRTAYAVQADPHGGVWIDFEDNDLAFASDGIVRFFKNQMDALNGDSVAVPLENEVLIGTVHGLTRLRSGKSELLSASQYPAFENITGIAQTRDGKTWLHSAAGVVRMDTRAMDAAFANPGATLPYALLDYRDGLSGMGLQNCDCNSIVKGADDRLYILTNHGVDEIDALTLHHNSLPPPVNITAVKANGVAQSGVGNLTLAKGTSNLEIDYTALSLVMPERNQFRYRMIGGSAAWVDAGPRRQAFFTNLGPGDYRFQVIASNNNGVWNNAGAIVNISIPPTFLQSTFFKVLCGVVVLSILFVLYSLRVRQLAGQIRVRNEVRTLERERIARELHDTLLQGFHALALRIQNAIEQLSADQPVRQILERELDRADAVLVEGRNRVKDLRAAYTVGDIPRLLREAAASFGSSTAFEVRTIGEPRSLNVVVGDEITRIGIEAVNNAMRHAKARNVEVQFIFSPNRFSLKIVDDGIGVSPDLLDGHASQGRFGLIGMRERAVRIKGKISITGIPGGGTTIELVVPAAVAYDDLRRHWFLRILFRR